MSQVTSTFEYKDVGIKLNIEPTIHLNNTVSLKMNMEISSLGDAWIRHQREAVQVRDEEHGHGDQPPRRRDGDHRRADQDEERKGKIKIPILGDIPLLGKFFPLPTTARSKTDILMSITPNIVRNMELPDKDIQGFWSGTEESYDTKPLFVTSAAKSSKPVEKPVDKTAVLKDGQREAPTAGAGEARKPALPAGGMEPRSGCCRHADARNKAAPGPCPGRPGSEVRDCRGQRWQASTERSSPGL